MQLCTRHVEEDWSGYRIALGGDCKEERHVAHEIYFSPDTKYTLKFVLGWLVTSSCVAPHLPQYCPPYGLLPYCYNLYMIMVIMRLALPLNNPFPHHRNAFAIPGRDIEKGQLCCCSWLVASLKNRSLNLHSGNQSCLQLCY
jgi:hypothetical protein